MDIVESFKRVAIVGAGVSGLACAKLLGDHGIDVVVFDKSRGTGGRASTHRRRHERSLTRRIRAERRGAWTGSIAVFARTPAS